MNFKRIPRVGIKEDVQRYRLRGVIEHSGKTTKEGHYVAYVREGEKWTRWDDETSTVIPWNDVKDKQAYILIWERSEDEGEEHWANSDQKLGGRSRECMEGVGSAEKGIVTKVDVPTRENQENSDMEIDTKGKKRRREEHVNIL